MIDYKSLPRKSTNKFNRRPKLLRINENVIGKSKFPHASNPAHDLRPQHETIVRFRLHDMAETRTIFCIAKKIVTASSIRGEARLCPTHDSNNPPRAFGKIKQEQSFFFRLIRLHRNGSIDPVSIQFRNQVVRQEIALQQPHAFVNPAVPRRIIRPEVLMRVDIHEKFKTTEASESRARTAKLSSRSIKKMNFVDTAQVRRGALGGNIPLRTSEHFIANHELLHRGGAQKRREIVRVRNATPDATCQHPSAAGGIPSYTETQW